MSRRLLLILLIAALALRLAYALEQDPLLPYANTGGDTRWYLVNAYALMTDAPPGSVVNGIITDIRTLGQPPVFFVFTGAPQLFFAPHTAIVLSPGFIGWHVDIRSEFPQAVIVVRVLQVLMSTATCFFAYRMASLLVLNLRSPQSAFEKRKMSVGATHKQAIGLPSPPQSPNPQTGSQGEGIRGRASLAGLIAAAALAFSPAFIMEAAEIKTETVFIFFVAAGMWLYLEAIAREEIRDTLLILAGPLLGLATLTRAVFLLFPLALVVYLVNVRMGWRRAALLLAIYALVVSTWTFYNLVRWNRFIIAGEGLPAFLYLGATGWDGPEAVDQRLLGSQPRPEATEEAAPRQPDFAQAASDAITSDIPGYIRHRLSDLAGAYLQPHGTLFFPGESLRELTVKWLRDDRTVSGLIALTQGDSFWQKLVLYMLHYAALIFGLLGMWRTRRNWRITLPMIGFILSTTLIHLFLLALPRYIFPTMVFWWVLAAVGMVGLGKESRESKESRTSENVILG
jgi:hypothetical protein